MSSTITTPYITINWERPFDPIYGEVITIPPWTTMWRGYNTHYPTISERPMYYSSEKVATGYVTNPSTHQLGCFMTTRPLRILDLRFMKHILSSMIQQYRSEPKYLQEFAQLMLSFGLCSLQNQITLAKNRYIGSLQQPDASETSVYQGIQAMEKILEKNALLEQSGIRIAETTNDAGTMAILQEIFIDHFDGFLSPRLQSVFHVEKKGEMSPELILFHPKRAGMIQIPPDLPTKKFRIIPYPTITQLSGEIEKSFIDFISNKSIHISLEINDNASSTFYMSGQGYSTGPHPLDVYYDKLDRGDKETLEDYKRCQEGGRRMKSLLRGYEAPSPCVPVTPFCETFIREYVYDQPDHPNFRDQPYDTYYSRKKRNVPTNTRKKGGRKTPKREKIINIYPSYYDTGA